MNIVFLSYHACVRCQKEALPLIERGHKVHMIAWKPPSYVENYTTFTHCFDLHQFLAAVKLYSKTADVFHAHNEPSWFVSAVKEVCDVPVVLDVHDSFLGRSTPEEEEERISQGKRRTRVVNEERNNFQLSDALVFPGERFKNLVIGEFGLTQPAIVLPSYLPESLYLYDAKEWWGGLVYEGRVDVADELKDDDRAHGFRYSVYEQAAKECKDLGIDFHLQTVRTDAKFRETYKDAFLHEPVGMDKLLRRLSRHDWGLVGNTYPTPEWDVAMPNKLFEYMAAGVPVVAINARECGDFVKEHGVGIEVESLSELRDRWAEHRQCRQNVYRKRKQWAMDAHIGKLEGLYRGLLHG